MAPDTHYSIYNTSNQLRIYKILLIDFLITFYSALPKKNEIRIPPVV